LEAILKELNFRMVFCIREPQSFAQVRVERLKVSGKPSQYDDLQIFVNEQEVMKQFVEASILETLWLDISDDHVIGAVKRIADWMEQTGGLYMSEQ
jgi:hypothetical protein